MPKLERLIFQGGLELAMAHGLPHLRTAWQVEKAVTEEESRVALTELTVDDGMTARLQDTARIMFADSDDEVVLLRFGHDYDPECKLTDDVLLALSDTVKDHCPQSVYSRGVVVPGPAIRYTCRRCVASSLWTPTWFQISHSSMSLGGSRRIRVIPSR